eukprot:scaffold1282_cov251-Pinguiococcus_pyrenoidosus.AAC.78
MVRLVSQLPNGAAPNVPEPSAFGAPRLHRGRDHRRLRHLPRAPAGALPHARRAQRGGPPGVSGLLYQSAPALLRARRGQARWDPWRGVLSCARPGGLCARRRGGRCAAGLSSRSGGVGDGLLQRPEPAAGARVREASGLLAPVPDPRQRVCGRGGAEAAWREAAGRARDGRRDRRSLCEALPKASAGQVSLRAGAPVGELAAAWRSARSLQRVPRAASWPAANAAGAECGDGRRGLGEAFDGRERPRGRPTRRDALPIHRGGSGVAQLLPPAA